ncbi:pentatricopeptide repeat-containing protein At4g02750-like [Macadamia integrifolia]|uniref:pentatricopeptide repeat-containing protein At4g02750-like n=1 Tax=Macadamia integrifolia TaxID=60698 RepID=UPI001C4F0AA4|nr:pentatricopeptide repeat-containing protein At4g02750-like [Macadamia integrifolia]XP_042509738.1 pentatricopeptide repeat-containing protein At4g02750-like [Macadamia integrifolia]XP_042509739.1 pentatricopeptide repeat-containing protein At4g02750-like [Macadamia integrifolia]XP_042509740.1 pentatricopeptide repeat-containing protein At4g02750-like [Macadamia integrifolia]XP_042509741.1 pentatricopeptide repeat-containing protein At4g02750-like [Macadamia integrifolia]
MLLFNDEPFEFKNMVLAVRRVNAILIMCSTCKSFHKRNIESLSDVQNHYGLNTLSNSHTKDTELVALTKRLSDFMIKGEVDYARKLFDQMGHRDSYCWNVMISGYTKNHRIGDARWIFDSMNERNTVSWNTMILAYTQERKMHIALKLFLVMPEKDIVSWTTIISGLCWDSQIEDAWKLFKQMPNRSSISWSSVISGFQQNGLAAETLMLFKEMVSIGIRPTSHSLTSALTASADLAAFFVGQQLYSQLLKRGFENNTQIRNSAISMFIKSGIVRYAEHILADMPQPDLVTWNSMIMGYGQHGYGFEATITFHQMQKAGFLPDGISFLGVLQGCSHCGFVEEASKYFNSMKLDYGISPKLEHYACMADVFARAGLLKEAFQIIMKMPFQPTTIFWRILLNGCRVWGYLKLGVHAADQILKLEPYNSSAHLMLMEMYASVRNWTRVLEIRKLLRERRARKEFSYSCIEIRGRVHLFTTRDETHFESDSIYMALALLYYDIVDCSRIDLHG